LQRWQTGLTCLNLPTHASRDDGLFALPSTAIDSLSAIGFIKSTITVLVHTITGIIYTRIERFTTGDQYTIDACPSTCVRAQSLSATHLTDNKVFIETTIAI
jgi:hypothetical protein